MTDPKPEVIEVHNVYAVYALDADGSEVDEPVAMYSRPQNWGSPRWHYERFRFEWITEDKHYINNAHCWTDLKLEQRGQYPGMFSQLVSQIMMPGSDPRLCGREYLDEEDFWDDSWGPIPPFADDEDAEAEEYY